jgi:hypothetical protein
MKSSAHRCGVRAAPRFSKRLLVAEHDGPTMFARIAMMQTLRQHQPKAASAPRRKRAKAYRVIR